MTTDAKPLRFLRSPRNDETCGLQEAAGLLCISESTLLRRVRAGIVPGAKIGRRLVFVRDDLLQLVRNNYKTPCSIDARDLLSGTSDSSSTDVNSASRLAQEIARKRRNLKPKLEIVRGGKSASASER